LVERAPFVRRKIPPPSNIPAAGRERIDCMSAATELRTNRRRAATVPYRAEDRCPVAKLAKEYAGLVAAWTWVDERTHSEDPSEALRAADLSKLIDDRLASVADQASFLEAQSFTGAAFQVMITRCTVNSISAGVVSEANRADAERCVDRCLYAVMSFLETMGADVGEVAREYCMSRDIDPRAKVAQAIREVSADRE